MDGLLRKRAAMVEPNPFRPIADTAVGADPSVHNDTARDAALRREDRIIPQHAGVSLSVLRICTEQQSAGKQNEAKTDAARRVIRHNRRAGYVRIISRNVTHVLRGAWWLYTGLCLVDVIISTQVHCCLRIDL